MERRDISLMTRTAIWTVALFSVAAIGFFVGRAWQHAKTGYYFQLINEREFPFAPDASLRLQHAIKDVGLPFLTPESSVLVLDDNQCGEVTLYEARRGFQ